MVIALVPAFGVEAWAVQINYEYDGNEISYNEIPIDSSIYSVSTNSGINTLILKADLASTGGVRIATDCTIKLANDITVSGIEIPQNITVTLDLNGHALNATGDDRVISNVGNLIIMDSTYGQENRPVHYFEYSSTGAWTLTAPAITSDAVTIGAISDATTLVAIYGGVITGGNAEYGGCINNDNYYSNLTASGITICGNTANCGGGISQGEDTKVYLDQVIIAGNFSNKDGGSGFYTWEGDAIITGCSIVYNNGNTTESDIKGGGVYIYDSYSHVVIIGGLVGYNSLKAGNNYSAYGAGIYNAGYLTLGGRTIITGNSINASGNVAYSNLYLKNSENYRLNMGAGDLALSE